MARLRRTLALFALGSAFVADGAWANGRFPRAQRLLERDGDPERLVLAATYGLLLSDDRGGEWRHVCELGFAFMVAEIDPLVGLLSDGSMLVKGIRSLNRAPSPFCAFEPVLGGVGSDTAVDFSVDALDRDRVIALVSLRGDAGGVVNRLYESSDAGRSFTEFGVPLPEDEVVSGVTLDMAPSDPNRLYVSATGRDAGGVFVRSGDRGASWTTSELSLATDEYAYIAAVDPTNADAIYLRTDVWMQNADGVFAANDALFYSNDGGESFRELFRMPGKLFGFALSPDGTEVLVGYGNPVEPSRAVDPSVLGIYRAGTTELSFEKIYDGSVSCLAWTENGLYVCTSQAERGFALGIAPNADFDLATENPFTPLLDLGNVRAPLDCPACTSGANCIALWSQTCAVFGTCDASAPVAGSGGANCPSGGAGGEPGEATGGSGGAGATTTRPTPSSPDSSCGCRSVGAEKKNARFAGLALVVLLLGLRRLRPARRPEPIGEPAGPPRGDY
jgi:hypothetical protein